MTRNAIYLRRLNPDGETLGVVDALEVDDRTFRQFVIDVLVEHGGIRAEAGEHEGAIATVVVGDRDAGELLPLGQPAPPAATSSAPVSIDTAGSGQASTPPPPTEPTPPTS